MKIFYLLVLSWVVTTGAQATTPEDVYHQKTRIVVRGDLADRVNQTWPLKKDRPFKDVDVGWARVRGTRAMIVSVTCAEAEQEPLSCVVSPASPGERLAKAQSIVRSMEKKKEEETEEN